MVPPTGNQDGSAPSPVTKYYIFNGMDDNAALQANGYVANGQLLGMYVGDIVFYVNLSDFSWNVFIVVSYFGDIGVNLALASGGTPPTSNAIITDSGLPLQTQSGETIVTQQ